MEKDPVCEMEVDPASAEYTSEYAGKKYYFCAAGCKRAFDKDPSKYVGQMKEMQSAASHNHGGGHNCC